MMDHVPAHDGSRDLARAASELAVRVPATLAPLARVAFDYWWSWSEDGPEPDRGLPMIAIGLLYWQGSYHQRLDPSGWQHDYWVETDLSFLPTALVTAEDDEPLLVRVPVRGREVTAQVWRVDVGRVPLYLLDT